MSQVTTFSNIRSFIQWHNLTFEVLNFLKVVYERHIYKDLKYNKLND